jgi:formamidopyrimidine-DNA glycosylase
MPELPEVEYAAGIARRALVGRVITHVHVLHRSQRRGLPASTIRRLTGDRVERIERRGKYQLLRLTSGRTLVVHFRMTGDWVVLLPDDAVPAAVRVVLTGDDGVRLALHDSRALSTVVLVEPDAALLTELGPDATDPAFSAAWLRERLARRRGPIKVALLDQGVVAGVGNIYAAEALWYARIDPRTPASALGPVRLTRLVTGVRRALRKALDDPLRYYGEDGVSDAVRFNVYDREGAPCRRCRKAIKRIVQGARSTYFCPFCQR